MRTIQATDQQAFVDALNAGRGRVYVPACIYQFTSDLVIPDGVELVGESRDSTTLQFLAGGVDLRGSASARKRVALKDLRIEGVSGCGVWCDWNQGALPILERVDIVGYAGMSTGLSIGSNNWIVSLRDVGIEGCQNFGLVIDALNGYANAIQFDACRFENSRGRNVYVRGPGNDTSTFQVNFAGCVIEGASYQTTGVNESVYVVGAGVNFDRCWFESHADPHWPVYEINVDHGARVNLHSCNVAWAQYGIRAAGQVVMSGLNTLRTSGSPVYVPTGGSLVEKGVTQYFGGGPT